MKGWIVVAGVLADFAVSGTGRLAARPAPAGRDIGAEVHRVFAAKCAGCHGSDLAKPKGRFGYVLDLRRVAGNPEMVIPTRPAESELWVLVQRDEMPPVDSPHGPLMDAQKEVIRAWITAGAPDAGDSSPVTEPDLPAVTSVTASLVDRTLRWMGKFHLLLLHFPIALVMAAGAREVWSAWRRDPVPSETVLFCLTLAALAAVPTATLGWIFAAAGNGAGSPQLLFAHRWAGTTTAVCMVFAAIYAGRDARRGVRSRLVRVLLASAIILTSLTAHLGGLLDRGWDFFTY